MHTYNKVSVRFWSSCTLNLDEPVLDGFYFPFGEFPEFDRWPDKMPPMSLLREIEPSEYDPREVLCVDHSTDTELGMFEAQCLMPIGELCGKSDMLGAARELGKRVAIRMGGAAESDAAIFPRWTFESTAVKARLRTLCIPLGEMRVGLQRHRALLFKVAADCLGIPCGLLRGAFHCGSEEAADVMVRQDGRLFLVDLMSDPGQLHNRIGTSRQVRRCRLTSG